MPHMSRRSAMGSAALAALACAILVAPAQAQAQAQVQNRPDPPTSNRTTIGQFTVENPTLENLGFEWAITGDANRNASVAVEYRKVGETAWRKGLPLMRFGGERVFRDVEHLNYFVPDGFAGSILNVEPGTEYETRFTLTDPDGVSGKAVQTAKVKTRVEPQPYAGGRTLHVYPPGYKGEKQEPSFTSILQAYYGAGLGDWSVVWERRVQPGDTILLHAGRYRNERLDYVDPMMTPFDGTMWLTAKGTAEKPITIKAAGDGEVILDGAGNHRLFDVSASAHHIFDGLTFRDTDVAIFAGMKEVTGAVGLTVKNSRFEDIGFGVWTEYAGSSDFYIADNVFLGRAEQRNLLVGWNRAWRQGDNVIGPYGSHEMRSYYAIKIYGPGHVIAHNSMAYFHDGIGISTYGSPEKDPARRASSIDIYGNDIHHAGDDFIESDGAVHNVRVYKNRGVNAAFSGYSSQPSFAGPVYFIRNIAYNTRNGSAFKIHGSSTGLFMWHNTLIGEQTGGGSSNTHYRNNLFIGRNAKQGVMRFGSLHGPYTADYNGYRANPGVAEQYRWVGPGGGQAPNVTRNFSTLAALKAGTGLEQNGLELDLDAFENMTLPNPDNQHEVYHAVDLNFRLKPGGKAVDAGDRIPSVNDDFTGAAPDLGALEVGQPEPHYGPRWLKAQPFYR
jgi:hypothetical protein